MSYGERRGITVINNPSKIYIFSLAKKTQTKVNANKHLYLNVSLQSKSNNLLPSTKNKSRGCFSKSQPINVTKVANRASCSIIKLETFWHHTTEHSRWFRSLFIIRRALKVGDRLPSLRHHVNTFKVLWSLSALCWDRASSGLGEVLRPTEDGEKREGRRPLGGEQRGAGRGEEAASPWQGHSNQCPSVTSHHTGDLELSASLLGAKGIRRISPGVKGERRNTLTTNTVVPTLHILIYPWHGHGSFAVSTGSIRIPFSAAKYLRVRKGWCIYVTQSRHNTIRQISDASPSLSLPCRCWLGSHSMLSMQITGVTIQLIW